MSMHGFDTPQEAWKQWSQADVKKYKVAVFQLANGKYLGFVRVSNMIPKDAVKLSPQPAYPRDKDPRQGGTPDFEARAWVAGQIVSAQAALDLLGQRAADAARPWPEFAEMDCFACHHDLKGKSWRQKRDADSPPRKAGVMPFRPWYVAMLERSLETLDKGEAKSVHEELESLRKRMEKTVPDRGAVSRQAKSLSSKLGPWLDKCDRAIDLDSLYQRIRKEDVPRARENWDTAAQTYLAVAALENAWNDLQVTATHGNLPSTLDAVRRELRWPKGYWSPPAFDGLSVLKKLERLRN